MTLYFCYEKITSKLIIFSKTWPNRPQNASVPNHSQRSVLPKAIQKPVLSMGLDIRQQSAKPWEGLIRHHAYLTSHKEWKDKSKITQEVVSIQTLKPCMGTANTPHKFYDHGRNFNFKNSCIFIVWKITYHCFISLLWFHTTPFYHMWCWRVLAMSLKNN